MNVAWFGLGFVNRVVPLHEGVVEAGDEAHPFGTWCLL